MNTTTKSRHSRGRSDVSHSRGSFQSGRPQRRPSNSGGGFRGGNRNRGGSRGGGRKMPSFDPSKFINTNPVETKEEMYTPKHTFSSFGLDARIVKAIASLKMDSPTPIQDQIIGEILDGRDVIGLAQTGTGKTAAFLIPLIQKTLKDTKRQTLILAPTRELAIQINEELYRLSRGLGIYSTICVGGMGIMPQIKSLRRTNHFIIGTPGRILDLIKRGNYKPEYTKTVVLDEADRMLDMGFINDMKSILSLTPKDRETLFFSATMNKEAEGIVKDFIRNPVTVSVKKKDVTDSILQDVVRHGHHDKFDTLVSLLKSSEFKRVLIFGSMKHSVEKLAQQLTKEAHVSADSIHGNKSHGQRQRALKRFKTGEIRVLVATDVAARGIHVDDVTHVINYDLPTAFEDYVHRIGRTGRGTKKGKALTFITA